jgi:hypothetical protein
MSKVVYLDAAVKCNICAVNDAGWDSPTASGPWAYLCDDCFDSHAARGAFGLANELVVGDKPEMSVKERRSAIYAALEKGDLDLVDDLIGDGDIAEWL